MLSLFDDDGYEDDSDLEEDAEIDVSDEESHKSTSTDGSEIVVETSHETNMESKRPSRQVRFLRS